MALSNHAMALTGAWLLVLSLAHTPTKLNPPMTDPELLEPNQQRSHDGSRLTLGSMTRLSQLLAVLEYPFFSRAKGRGESQKQ